MIDIQLLQNFKLGPGAAPFNPVPYQINQIQSQIQPQVTLPNIPTIPAVTPGFVPPVPHIN